MEQVKEKISIGDVSIKKGAKEEHIVIEVSPSTGNASVWKGTQDFIIEIAKSEHGFCYREFEKEQFIECYGDFEGWEEPEKIIAETGSVVQVLLNHDDMNHYKKSESKTEFEYAIDSIFSDTTSASLSFPCSEIEENLKTLNDLCFDALKKFMSNAS